MCAEVQADPDEMANIFQGHHERFTLDTREANVHDSCDHGAF